MLFGTFYLPKGKLPSDDIGVGDIPHYPQTFAGLMLAPFTYGRLKAEAAAGRNADNEATKPAKTLRMAL